jgi:transcriptional regulator with GAF, ATPase, and Fis domain
MKTLMRRIIASGENHTLFTALMKSVSEPVFVIEPSTWCLVEVNQQAANTLGYSIDELLTLGIDRIFSPGAEFVQQLATTNHLSPTCRVQLVTKHGRRLSSVLVTHPVEDCKRELVLVLARDAASPEEVTANSQACRFPTRGEEQPEERQEVIDRTFSIPSIVGQSEQIHATCRLIGLVAQTDTTVLIQGESGTGKELVAQAIHCHSQRNSRSLVTVNCAALTETLLESELFGHKKGAFTGAIQDRKGRFKLADGGTIILDEVDSLSLSGQAKLLRVLQEKEFEPVGDSTTVRVDARVVAITNADLTKEIHEGRFREDLYYRLNAFPIRLPVLRERKADIPLLARHFLHGSAASLKKQIGAIEADAMARLIDYSWPGNVRELENTIEYAAILEKGSGITASSLPDKLQPRINRNHSLKERLEAVEKQIIIEALSTANGVRTRTAEFLGIDRRNLGYFLHKHHIHFPVHAPENMDS